MLRKIALIAAAFMPLVACGSDARDKSEENVTLQDAATQDEPNDDVNDSEDDAGTVARDASESEDDASTVSSDADGSAPMDGATIHSTDAGNTDAARDAGSPSTDAAEDATSAADTGSDATTTIPDAAQPVSFSISVRRGNATPLANAPVFFHDANGARIAESTTGADGRASHNAIPAMVTVIAPKNGAITAGAAIVEPQLFTVTSLSAGDDFVLELPADAPTAQPENLPGYSVTVKAPATPPASTTSVRVLGGHGGCARMESTTLAQPYLLPWPDYCAVKQANSLLAIAFNAGNVVTGYAFAKGVAPFAAAPAAVALETWTAPAQVVVTAKNLPAGAANASFFVLSEGAAFDPVERGERGLTPAGAGTRSYTWLAPQGFAEEQIASVDVNGPLARQVSSLAVRGAPKAAIELDLAAGVPGATAIGLDRAAPSRPIVQWTNAGSPGNVADGTAVLLEWPTTPWLIVTAGTIKKVTLPELPENRREFLNAAALPAMYISHFASSGLSSYRDFVKEPIRPTLEGPIHLLGRALPAETNTQAVSWSAQ